MDNFKPALTFASRLERTCYSTVKDKKMRSISNRTIVSIVCLTWVAVYLIYSVFFSGANITDDDGEPAPHRRLPSFSRKQPTQIDPSFHSEMTERWDSVLDKFVASRKETKQWFHDESEQLKSYAELLRIADALHLRTSHKPDDIERLKTLQYIEHEALPFFKKATDSNLRFDDILRMPEVPRHLTKNSLSPKPERRGRGIIISASKYQFRFVLHLVANIRKTLKCDLPIEVWNNGKKDISFAQQRALQSFGGDTTFKNLADYDIWDIEASGIGENSWTLKAFALLASNLDEPLLVDADTVFMQKPDVLWEDEGYQKTGTLFFHDRLVDFSQELRPVIEQVLQDRNPSETLAKSRYWSEEPTRHWKHQMDSGALIMNKGRHEVLVAVLFVAWMNSKDPHKYADEWLFGDKETFWLACEALEIPYHFSPFYGSALGPLGPYMRPKEDQTQQRQCVIGDNILHLDEDTKPLWLNGGLFASKHKDGSGWLDPAYFSLDDGIWKPWDDDSMFPFRYNGTFYKTSPQIRELWKDQCKLAEEVEVKFANVMGQGRSE